MKDVLLIGNSDLVMKKYYGKVIDESPMYVVRFNQCKTRGFEKFIGTKTDMIVLCGGIYYHNGKVNMTCPTMACAEAKTSKVYRMMMNEKRKRTSRVSLIMEDLTEEFGVGVERGSTGLLTALHFLKQGRTVHLHGFSFTAKHYFDRGKGHSPHDWPAERAFMHKLMDEGRVKSFDDYAVPRLSPELATGPPPPPPPQPRPKKPPRVRRRARDTIPPPPPSKTKNKGETCQTPRPKSQPIHSQPPAVPVKPPRRPRRDIAPKRERVRDGILR